MSDPLEHLFNDDGPDEAQMLAFVRQLIDAEADGQRTTVAIGPFGAFTIISLLQVALRNPTVTDLQRQNARGFIAALAPLFVGSAGEELIRRGNHPDFDSLEPVPPDGPPPAGHETGLLYTIRCPQCGQLPDLLITPHQVMCGNDDGCKVVQWSPSQRVEDMERHEIPALVDPDLQPSVQEVLQTFAGRPQQVPGSPADDAREKEIRAWFHQYGYRCADGGCAACGPGKY